MRRRRPSRFRRRRLARRLRRAGRAVSTRASAPSQGDRLFRNRGDGTFEDVTESAGIAAFPGGYGHGVTVGDYDNDGRPDLFVTRWRSYALYRNTGDGRFDGRDRQSGPGAVTATGRPRRPSPISTATATSTSTSAITSLYDPSNPRRCTHPESPGKHECNPLDFPVAARPCLSQRRRQVRRRDHRRRVSSIPTVAAWVSWPPTSTTTTRSTSTSPTT